MSRIQTQGFSAEADFIATISLAERRELLRSTMIGAESAFDELGNVSEECRYDNWDGYGAKAITTDTLRNAYCVLEAIPIGYPSPSIGAEPDGAITLEWHRDRRHTLSVSVDDDGNLTYAALLGPSKVYGVEIFFGDLPAIILELVVKVLAA
jgi:hypothetical protein